MWSQLIAVLGALAGVVVAGQLQQRSARADRAESREDGRRHDQVQAVTALSAALDDHRRAMWTKEERRLTWADADARAEARTASHATRAAISTPLATLAILLPDLAEAARAAVQATYGMRDAVDLRALGEARAAAVAAGDRLLAAASQHLA